VSFDAHKNFSYSTVATAPSPATSGTSLVVQSGDGAKFPTVPFNATVWPAGVQPTSDVAEIVRVTARSTDTLTITRAQEASSARSITVGDQIAATITAKTLTDIEATASASGTSFPGSPSDGDLFYRTDRRIMYEYDLASTSWLSLDRKYVPATGTRVLNGAANVTGIIGFWAIFEDVYIESWVTLVRTGGTNNGSNFSTGTLKKQSPAEADTTITTFSTSADSTTTNVIHNVSVAAVVATASFPAIYANVTATGSPTNGDFASYLILRSVG